MSITGVSFSEKSLQRLIDHHGAHLSPRHRDQFQRRQRMDQQMFHRFGKSTVGFLRSNPRDCQSGDGGARTGRTKINELMKDGRS